MRVPSQYSVKLLWQISSVREDLLVGKVRMRNMTLVECPAAKQSVGRALGHQHIPPNLWPERNFGFGTYAVNEVPSRLRGAK